MSTSAIAVQQLSKTFGSVRALDGLDLEVREGEVHGFLGPNGAGKSTTIRILLGLLRAGGGQVRLEGTRGPTPSPCIAGWPMSRAMWTSGRASPVAKPST